MAKKRSLAAELRATALAKQRRDEKKRQRSLQKRERGLAAKVRVAVQSLYKDCKKEARKAARAGETEASVYAAANQRYPDGQIYRVGSAAADKVVEKLRKEARLEAEVKRICHENSGSDPICDHRTYDVVIEMTF